MSKMRTCHICGTQTSAWCGVCLLAFDIRRPVAEMSIHERVAEMQLLFGPLEIPFGKLHQRFEELVGRPVWTHEFAFPDALVQEVLAGKRATMNDVIEKIHEEKRIIVMVAP